MLSSASAPVRSSARQPWRSKMQRPPSDRGQIITTITTTIIIMIIIITIIIIIIII